MREFDELPQPHNLGETEKERRGATLYTDTASTPALASRKAPKQRKR